MLSILLQFEHLLLTDSDNFDKWSRLMHPLANARISLISLWERLLQIICGETLIGFTDASLSGISAEFTIFSPEIKSDASLMMESTLTTGDIEKYLPLLSLELGSGRFSWIIDLRLELMLSSSMSLAIL